MNSPKTATFLKRAQRPVFVAIIAMLSATLVACPNRGRRGATSTPSPAATKSASPSPEVSPTEEGSGGTASDDHPTIAAAGDIACAPNDPNYRDGEGVGRACRQRATSDLVMEMKPTGVLGIGDLQYEGGEFENFMAVYEPTWGRLKNVTWPAVGNHEYRFPGAAGYVRYFGERAGDPSKLYYSTDIGPWHVISINSNCTRVGGCRAGSAQQQWLAADLAAHQSKCTLAFWHHPLFSSGEQHGPHPGLRPIWRTLYDAGADVVLSGHDHLYERFAPQTFDGEHDAERGIRQFTVGTGGESHYGFAQPLPNSEERSTGVFGVLKLTLLPDSYEWEFVPEKGKSFKDSGSAPCH